MVVEIQVSGVTETSCASVTIVTATISGAAVNRDFFPRSDQAQAHASFQSPLISVALGVDNDKRLSERKSNAFPPPPPWGSEDREEAE
ncbi:hypothetical protein AGABI1DRAFT_128351 [Agaricus bisporus var. burnettii JB137-S8]|uniref:Uncharacterized protein n=1 Tax=Agaricus bisporus var. burnettii (strain JB137-S8 / ATCC MYA-4627 / FGSC 10392) TaxID=597362 RepID=K5VXI7_AGABU|nr:uncharacterized protein AGABI1DRAFT_128351 [Agaricus bisporus var. burnettii JB137-S8]EKM79189.1 hypothetical protein AGABI1DRAFT_128351 [Agaricus bisporus var. burnettii JB137-S8]